MLLTWSDSFRKFFFENAKKFEFSISSNLELPRANLLQFETLLTAINESSSNRIDRLGPIWQLELGFLVVRFSRNFRSLKSVGSSPRSAAQFGHRIVCQHWAHMLH